MLFNKNAAGVVPCFCLLLLAANQLAAQPLDDITFRSVVQDRRMLNYDVPQERDVFWQKTTWRVLDVREKMNLPFTYPEAPFFDILTQAAQAGEITLYSAENDKFTQPLAPENLDGIMYRVDTILITDPQTWEESIQIVRTSIFYEDIKRFRIKEMWYFDAETASLRVRILGIAPLKEKTTENGDVIGEMPLFWVHYPSAREVLTRHLVFNGGNEASRMTWEDLFEMRMFSSAMSSAGWPGNPVMEHPIRSAPTACRPLILIRRNVPRPGLAVPS
ncbi:MAG: gliding motility protein GldN, partial [Bacteroidota bacterium]